MGKRKHGFKISNVSLQDRAGRQEGAAGEATEGEAAATGDQPLADITNKETPDQEDKAQKNQNRPQKERRERGPPADGVPSKTKVMVANLPYELTEEKVRRCRLFLVLNAPY